MKYLKYMQIDNIPIILHTCDKYSKYWDYWWYFTNKYCCHKNIIFCSEELSPSFHASIKIFKTGIGPWGKRLLKILEYLNLTHIFYMQEDFWPIKTFPYHQKIIDKVIYDQIDCWRICENSNFYSLLSLEHNIYQFRQHSLYTLSHQFSLWKTDFFKKYIIASENPWENEIKGSLRMNQSQNHKIYLQTNKWYESVVRKGILQENGKKMLEQENINICGI